MGRVSYIIGAERAFYWSLKAQTPHKSDEPMALEAFALQDTQTMWTQ